MATDQELLSALRAGKSQGLEAAIGQYSAYVAAVIDYQLGDLGSKADVEELSADVFYTLWQWRNRLKTDHLRGWLGTTARNIARDFLRKKRLSTVAAEDYLTVCDAQAQTLLERAERTELVRRALDDLEPENREIFLRYYFYNQPLAEIGEAAGLSQAAVKSRLQRGRKKLKEILTQGGYLCED